MLFSLIILFIDISCELSPKKDSPEMTSPMFWENKEINWQQFLKKIRVKQNLP